uniref:Ycf34 n=1 Tax=Dicranema revolutum TaxID=239144 RepID=A0A4D6WS92_9FLOR|nr:hypothetical protein [Dicranema revolutum]
MCICINCRHVHSCTTYKIVQKKHYIKTTNTSNISFIPNNTLIEVNITNYLHNIKFEWDLIECSSFVEQPGYWTKNLIH